ncbi:hypothetical protein CN172_20140 [Sinorhizobium meliloti]|nr:hypothetical protein CN232_32550 [Sinorhizobium meliloti]RVH36203.1 hypothetical protein CN208_32655 [Sinorhizobium meliloti]RVK11361.1 hypothetical protein CN172_20140 [Sinorhizobium meliloti]
MKARIAGAVGGALIGFMIGSGTGIVGGIFGGVAGASIFTISGAAWGFSAGPDVANAIRRWRAR